MFSSFPQRFVPGNLLMAMHDRRPNRKGFSPHGSLDPTAELQYDSAIIASVSESVKGKRKGEKGNY